MTLPAAAAIARGLFVALLLAAAASVDAMGVPTKWVYGGGMEDKKTGGVEVTVKKNGKVVVRPKMKPRSMRTTPSSYKPKNKAAGSPLTYTLKAGSSASDPNGAWYTVTWSGITLGDLGGATDRIAVLNGAPINPDLHPVKYVFVVQVAPTTFAQGSGTVDIWLPFLRSPVSLAYITESNSVGIWSKYIVVGAPVVINPVPANVPHNVKLTYTSKGSTITTRAVWQTVAVGTASVKMMAQFRIASAIYGGAGSGVAYANPDAGYKASDMCDNPAMVKGFATPGSIWSADMANLQPGTKYFYKVGDVASNTWSPEFSFTTPPADASVDPSTEARILLTADAGQYAPDNAYMPDGNTFGTTMLVAPTASATPSFPAYCGLMSMLAYVGSGPGQQPATKEVYKALSNAIDTAVQNQKDYHAYFLNGDIAYARGEAHQWDTWQWAMSPILTRVPALYTPGNHEADDATTVIGKTYADAANYTVANVIPDGGGECNIPYRTLLQPPQPSGATSDWYSATIGPVYVIQLNSEQNLASDSAQYKWLAAELASVDRKKTPWLVVSLHRPMYVDTIQMGDQNNAWVIRNAIEPLLVQYQVDMVWAGHIHAYQRSCLGGVVKGKCQAPVQGPTPVGSGVSVQPKAPVYVLTGNAGFQAPIDLFSTPPEWEVGVTGNVQESGKVTYAYGYSEVVATPTQLTFKSYLTNGTLTGDQPMLFDSFMLTKPLSTTYDPNAGLALYNSVSTPGSIIPVPVIDVASFFRSMVTAYGENSGSNDVTQSWFVNNCQTGQALYDLVTPPPGVKTQWAVQDVWKASVAFLDYLNNFNIGTGILPTTMDNFRKSFSKELFYFTNLLGTGGRGYFPN